MKKTLMVLTFALCATFVFAQTTMTPRAKAMKAPTTAKTAVSQQASASSIFTKDQVLATVDFSDGTKNGNTWTGTGYETGVVESPTSEAHGETYAYSFWQRWTLSSADSAAMIAMYPRLNSPYFGGNMGNYILRTLVDTAVSTAANGFMMISLYDQGTPMSGNFNAYIKFPGINASGAGVVDVQFFQSYRRYYDKTYLDYSANGTIWSSMEINVTGIDIEVNGSIRKVCTYTLPLAAAGQSNLSVRLRAYSPDANRGAYGYFWVVDDVNIIAGPADRINFYEQEYTEGGYSLIPQGMGVNPAWHSTIKNTGSNAQSNLMVNLETATVTDENFDVFAQKSFANINAGNSMDIYVDNGGWYNLDSLDARGWYGYIFDRAAHSEAGSTALPTSEIGEYLMRASIGNADINHYYDTMFYAVGGADNQKLQGAYRWGHDNGILAYTSDNIWVTGYIQQGGTWYITDDPEEVDFYAPGFRVTNRYTTDVNFPAGWVIRGVEMVASPVSGYYTTGAEISPVLYKDVYNGGSVSFHTVATGAGSYEVLASDINDSTMIGRETGLGYKTLGNYNSIYIPFPEQPALEQLTSYRVGYQIESESFFTLAQEAHGYYYEKSPTRPDRYDTIYHFANFDHLKQYSHYFEPIAYQTYNNDPIHDAAFGFYVDYNPMIRLVVGPALDIQRYNVEIECVNDEFGTTIYSGEEVCGETLTPAEGSTFTVFFEPAEECHLETLKIDGQVIDLYDEATGEGDEHFFMVESADGVYYGYTFTSIAADHQVEVTFAEGTPVIGIDPIAANVRMNLQPNPATSQVTMNIEGVEGMVNCSIIDMSGRVVYNADMNAQNAQVINLNSLAKGAYFVRVTNSNFTKVEKLIVR